MKILPILNEAVIPSKYNEIRQQLETNKKRIQRSFTRIGVTNILRELFPNEFFSWFSSYSYPDAQAAYDAMDNQITLYNKNKMFSPRVARTNWDFFANRIAVSLSHENIHRDQHERAGRYFPGIIRYSKKDKLSDETRANFEAMLTYLSRIKNSHQFGSKEYIEADSKIEKILKKAEKGGVHLGFSDQGYYGSDIELMTYANEIAIDLVNFHSTVNPQASKEEVKKKAIEELSIGTSFATSAIPDMRFRIGSPRLAEYSKLFGRDHKKYKKLLKLTVAYIQNL